MGAIVGGLALLAVAGGVGFVLMNRGDDSAPTGDAGIVEVAPNVDPADPSQELAPVEAQPSVPVTADDATILADFQEATKKLAGASVEQRKETLDKLAAKYELDGQQMMAMIKRAMDANLQALRDEANNSRDLPQLSDEQTRQVVEEAKAAMREAGIAATMQQRSEAFQKVADKHHITKEQLLAVVQQFDQQERDERQRLTADAPKLLGLPFWVPLEIADVTPPQWPSSLNGKTVFAGDPGAYLLPAPLGPYLLTGLSGFADGQAVVADLATGKVAGKLQRKIEAGKRFLSPDGRFLCVESLRKSDGNPWVIYSFDSGEQSQELKDLEMSAHQFVQFIDPTHLLTIYYIKNEQGLQSRWRVWDVTTGEVTASHEGRLPTVYKDKIGVSPDGRYALLADTGSKLTTIDLTTCQPIAELDVGTVMGNTGSVAGIQFSPDGRQIGLLYNKGFDTVHVVSLDPRTGDVIDRFDMAGYLNDLVEGGSSYNGPRLMWFPDGMHVLIDGAVVINLPAGRRVWQFDVATLRAQNYALPNAPRPAADGCLVVCTGKSDEVTLQCVPIELDKNPPGSCRAGSGRFAGRGCRPVDDAHASLGQDRRLSTAGCRRATGRRGAGCGLHRGAGRDRLRGRRRQRRRLSSVIPRGKGSGVAGNQTAAGSTVRRDTDRKDRAGHQIDRHTGMDRCRRQEDVLEGRANQ